MSEQKKKPQAMVVLKFSDTEVKMPWAEYRAKELHSYASMYSSEDPRFRQDGKKALSDVAQELHDLKMDLYLERLRSDELRHLSSEGGKAGADVRWGNRWGEDDAVLRIISALAECKGDWGAPLCSSDLWSMFYNKLDENQLSPNDKSGCTVKDDDVMAWGGNPEGMTFKTFKNKISIARGEAKK
ncbi:MAG: hypothetical protein HPY82_08345 [Gammaproteobacteria bacterium]|nr:hypothetical protein [Gammaproteobacteria bacterium]